MLTDFRRMFVSLGLGVALVLSGGCSRESVEAADAETTSTETVATQSREAAENATNDVLVVPTAAAIDIPTDFSLAEETQVYLWDIEHLAFVMGQEVLPIFRRAIREGEKDALVHLLAPDFRARVFTGDGTRIQKGLLRYEKWSAGDSLTDLDRNAFGKTLVAWGQGFTRIDRVKMHIYYFSPSKRGELDGGWESKWDLQILGELAQGQRVERRVEWSLKFSKLTDQMASEPGWIKDLRIITETWKESPRPLLEEITASTGIDTEVLTDTWDLPGPPYPMVPGISRLLDFDRDGLVDLLVTDVRFCQLYRGLGDGRFEDVTATAGLEEVAQLGSNAWLSGALVVDLDNDGYEDLLFSVEQKLEAGRVAHAIAVFKNLGKNPVGGRFQSIPEEVHHLGQRYRLLPRGLAVADFDQDGLVDLFLGAVGAQPPPEHRKAKWIGDKSFREGALVRNLGEFRFEDATESAGMKGEHIDIASATWLDLESDGDADLFLANHMGPNLLWENQGDGTFKKRPQPQGYGGFSMGATFGDLDQDGDPDLYVANMYTSAGGRIIDNLQPSDYPEGMYELVRGFATGNELYTNEGAGVMQALGAGAGVANSGWAYGPEVVDLDGDGALDIYSPAGFQSVKRGEPDG